MLQFLPQGLSADSQDLGRLDPIAICEPQDRDDMLPLRLFSHFSEGLSLYLESTRCHNEASCHRFESHGQLRTGTGPDAEAALPLFCSLIHDA
jgi:hypothetical protein